jgi:FAD/FMN-containing dehydrogenase
VTDQELRDALAGCIEGEVSTHPATLTRYSSDASLFTVRPRVVVYPKNTSDIEKLVRYVAGHPGEKLSLTVRSGGTDMSGGPLSDSIVVDVQRYLNGTGAIKDGEIETEPGAYYRHLERETLRQDLLMPAYPASRQIATIGGMIANNAGGEKTLSYGKMDRYVAELDVVLADGNTYTVRPLTLRELEAKMNTPGYEGELYLKLYELVREHHDLLHEAQPRVSKNSSGYALWDVWDGKHFDLTKLIVGSQGTLGIITRARLRLVPVRPHSRLLVIFLRDFEPLARLIPEVLKHGPESFESYDDHTLKLALRYLPEITRQMRAGSFIKLLPQFVPEFKMLLTGGMPKLVLMAEFTGDDLRDVRARARAAEREVRSAFPRLRTLVTKSRKQGKKFWVVRRESFNLLRKHTAHKHTAPFIDDICVRPDQLPEFLPELSRIMGEYRLTYTLAGHIGDANFHIIPLMDLADPAQRAIIPELSKKVFDLVFKYGGSMSGEHNDGLVRTPYLRDMYGLKVYQLFEETKEIFDPQGIFNPGKKVGGSLKESLEHLIKD